MKRRARKAYNGPRLPSLYLDLKAEDYEWNGPIGLTTAELAECWARVARNAQAIANDARAIAEALELEQRRKELIAILTPMMPTGPDRHPRHVQKSIARKAVKRALG